MLFTILDDSIEFYATSPIFIGCLDGGCEEKKHNARYSQQLKTGTGQRASLRTVPPPRDRLPTGGQSELVLWWFVPDHIHSVTSSTPMFRPKRLALAVTIHRNFEQSKVVTSFAVLLGRTCHDFAA